MSKKIAVLGSGANGASIGADLTKAGLDVVLIDQWPEHVAAMRQRGARIEMPDEVLVQPVRVRRPHLTARGTANNSYLPVTSIDTTVATLGKRFGVGPNDMGLVIPNLQNFSNDLGFLA